MSAQRRVVIALNEGERNAIWQYLDPIFPAHYAWHPDEGWLYCTRSNPQWRNSTAASGAVTKATIDPGTPGGSFGFTEVARFLSDGWWLFTPSGPLAVPDSIGTGWELAAAVEQ